MSLDLQVLTNAAFETGESPFLRGGDAVFANFTGGALIVQGRELATDAWATFVTVPAGGMIRGASLPNFLRVSTEATVYALAG